MKKALLSAILLTIGFSISHAQIIISEVDPTGSSNSSYAADWFELTNTGTSAVNITGWKMDDNSNSFGSAVSIRGVTSIAAGQSVVFIESNTSGSTDATVEANFKTTWFGANVPTGFTIGAYGGSGVGLSATGDAVNIFNSTGTLITRVDFGASTDGVAFDNSAGLNNVTISTLSSDGTNGAFTSSIGEIGSPGTISNTVASTPEPSTYALILGGALMLVLIQQRRRAKA